MPELRVIQGGGKGGGGPPNDRHAEAAEHHLRRLIIEILRAVARGDDARNRVGSELVALLEHLSASKTPIGETVHGAVSAANTAMDDAFDLWERGDRIPEIVFESLRVAAEKCADDPAAVGRSACRVHELRSAIDRHVKAGKNRAARIAKTSDRILSPKRRKPAKGKPAPKLQQ